MSTETQNAITQAAREIVGREMNVRWYWKLYEVEVEKPDHVCSPECICWEQEPK